MKNLSNLKIALVCDWLVGYGGAERVLLELHKMFPEAPIYTSQYDPGAIDWFQDADVRTTWLQKLPKSLRKFLPVFRAWSFSHLNLKDYDLIISSSGAEAKGVKTGPNTLHVNYCHSPTHYYWIRYDEYLSNPGFGSLNWLARLGLKLFVGPLRTWDLKAAKGPGIMIANSNFTKANIKKYYGRDSVVIHPPVDTQRFAHDTQVRRQGFVTAGRQTPYMRKDLAVQACTKLGLPLKVIGIGPEHSKLIQMAGPSIEFLTDVSDEDMPKSFGQAEAFLLPGKEDFGIVSVEALASGTPVIAYKAGGALDYVVPGKTGEFFEPQTVEALVKVLSQFDSSKYSEDAIKRSSGAFSAANFQQAIRSFIIDQLKS